MCAAKAIYPSLKDRVVLITGGGRGLGREMALALIEAGARVAITGARAPSELTEVEQEARRIADTGRLITLRADVRSYEDCVNVTNNVIKTFGGIHALVNNAGRGLLLISENYVERAPKFWEVSVGGWREIAETNFIGPFNMARAVTPHLVKQGFGRIVNISTSAVTMTRKGYSPYGPSKAGLEAMSAIWAKDLDGTGVTVNVLLPGGATDTKLLPEMQNKRGSDGQLLDPKLMRAPILWLCADNSNGHTGERYIAKLWKTSLKPDKAAAAARQPKHELPTVM
ncbi:MAG: SDR family NAD(P)-dependent oxidoreductase [Alphaproteobacteria bacterium]